MKLSPLLLADALLDALERAGLVPGAFGWERAARRVIAEELERIEGEEFWPVETPPKEEATDGLR